MSSHLYTGWGEFKQAWEEILTSAQRTLDIFDGDLSQLDLHRPKMVEKLQDLLGAHPAGEIRFILRKTDHLYSRYSLLVRLADTFSHKLTIRQVPEHLCHLRDAIMIADTASALIRFDQDLPRSKLIRADAAGVKPYQTRFNELWHQNTQIFNPRPLGL